MMNKHPGEFRYHELRHFGEGGLRFREANSIVDEILASCKLRKCGLSYKQVTRFMLKKWREVSNSSKASTTPNGELREFSSRPAYVQLDHVYGLPGETTRRILALSENNLRDSHRNLQEKKRNDSDLETHADNTSCESAVSSLPSNSPTSLVIEEDLHLPVPTRTALTAKRKVRRKDSRSVSSIVNDSNEETSEMKVAQTVDCF